MKKIIVVLMCLCLVCSAALAETVIELNWVDFGTEEILAAGELQKIEIPGQSSVTYWIPSIMGSVDVSVIDGPFKPTALYATEDQAYSVAIFVAEVESAEQYAKLMESEGGGVNFRNVKINGVDCIAYEVESAQMDSLIYPVSANVIVNFNCSPLNGDEGWDATKGAIFASIQIAE